MTLLDLRPITGAPYAAGDLVMVEVDGKWQEAVVDGVSLVDAASKFGLRWSLHVMVLATQEWLFATCDDNGRNHTWRKQVCPSNRILEG